VHCANEALKGFNEAFKGLDKAHEALKSFDKAIKGLSNVP
jgi:hypothetical protein